MSYAVGIDLGGTKTDILVRDGTVTRSLSTDGGNLRMDDPAGTARRITDALAPVLLRNAPVRLCMGAAGGDDPSACDALVAEFHTHVPQLEHATIFSDQRIAWEAAFNQEPGVLVIAGTGSGCFTVDASGQEHRTGGWGPRIGDPGSGRSLGTAALRITLAAAESGTFSLLGDKVTRHLAAGASLFGPDAVPAKDLLRFVYAPDFEASVLAPVVLAALNEDCADALSLAMEEAQALAAQCRRLVDTAPSPQKRIALMGGLTRSAAYVRVLTAVLEKEIPGYGIETPNTKPVTGALRLALRADARRDLT